MLHLEKVTRKNVWELLRLHVSPEQENFVAPNDLSLIEAYIAISGNGNALPFGIYDDDTPVGFLMIGYDVDDSYENPPAIAWHNYSIWRFMIDEKYQRRGLRQSGTQAGNRIHRNLPLRKSRILLPLL